MPTTPPPISTPAATPTDEELVARARAKDFGAFEQLLDRYEDKIFRLAFGFVRNETEAEEVLLDTFLQSGASWTPSRATRSSEAGCTASRPTRR